MASNTGDIVLDCFLGSGTTAAVAQNLGRRWIGCDINKGAIQTTVKRLRGIIIDQIAEARKKAADAKQGTLLETAPEGEQAPAKPCAFGFTVWRVNDYDLQIQHNEAVNLACEHIGITRNRADTFFDGTWGEKKLAKIVPFGHPLTVLDLEELKKELKARPDEERDIAIVCLGKEAAVDAWLEEWNRLRTGTTKKGMKRDVPNKIQVIELNITRKKNKLIVEIKDFISPTIIERLHQQAGLVKPQIEDWRAMVDCVMIDPAYDGSILNVVLADVPERKSDFVKGHYELAAPEDETTVAVKIIDMLGEEVLVTRTV